MNQGTPARTLLRVWGHMVMATAPAMRQVMPPATATVHRPGCTEAQAAMALALAAMALAPTMPAMVPPPVLASRPFA